MSCRRSNGAVARQRCTARAEHDDEQRRRRASAPKPVTARGQARVALDQQDVRRGSRRSRARAARRTAARARTRAGRSRSPRSPARGRAAACSRPVGKLRPRWRNTPPHSPPSDEGERVDGGRVRGVERVEEPGEAEQDHERAGAALRARAARRTGRCRRSSSPPPGRRPPTPRLRPGGRWRARSRPRRTRRQRGDGDDQARPAGIPPLWPRGVSPP